MARGLGLTGYVDVPTDELLNDYDKDVLTILPGNVKDVSMLAVMMHRFGKERVKTSEYEWWDTDMEKADSVVTTANTSAGGTTLQVGVGHGKRFPIWTEVWNVTKHEHAQVTLNDGTDILTIRKPFHSGGGDSQWDIGDKIVSLGQKMPEGAAPVLTFSTDATKRSNLIEYEETSFALTNRLKMEGMKKTGDEYLDQQKRKMIQHILRMEMSLIANAKGKTVSAGGQNIWTTDGLIASIPAARRFTTSFGGSGAALGATTLKDLTSKLEDVCQYGNPDKFAFTSPSAFTSIHRMMLSTGVTVNFELVGSEEVLGKRIVNVNFRKLSLAGKSLTFVEMPVWKEMAVLADHMLVLDPQFIKMTHLGPGGILTEKDVVKDGATQQVDRFFSYFGLKMKNLNAHALMSIPTVA